MFLYETVEWKCSAGRFPPSATLCAVFNWNDQLVARIQQLLMERNPTFRTLWVETVRLGGEMSMYRNPTSKAFIWFLEICLMRLKIY